MAVMSMSNPIRELRKQQGLPLEVACKLARVSVRSWWCWERWGIPPRSRETAVRIANLLGATPEELGWKPEKEEVSRDET